MRRGGSRAPQGALLGSFVLRFDPAFKLACERMPETGDDLMSQPTLSRLENAPSWRDLARMVISGWFQVVETQHLVQHAILWYKRHCLYHKIACCL